MARRCCLPRVLVVDDYPDGADALGEYLRLQGWQVTVAGSLAAVAGLGDAETPDAAVIDLVLPDGDGFAVARLLRARPRTARIPLIAWTGLYREGLAADTASAGFDHLLLKPADPRELAALLAGSLLPGDDEPPPRERQ